MKSKDRDLGIKILTIMIIVMTSLSAIGRIKDYESEPEDKIRMQLIENQRNNYERRLEIINNYTAILLTRGQMEGMTPEIQSEWEKLFNLIRGDLANSIIDLENREDEEYWKKMIGYYVTGLTIVGDLLDNGSEEYYNLALFLNNFIDLKTNHKNLISNWEDIQKTLSPDEIAIEILYLPNEIILLGNEGTPISIEIPEEMIENIEGYNFGDPLSISQFHNEGSPLQGILKLIEPYLHNKNKIYLSTSNIYNRFNWSILPYKRNKLCDYVEVVRLFSTSEIEKYKIRESNRAGKDVRKAVLVGGLNYEEPEKIDDYITALEEKNGKEEIELRKGYNYLPYSYVEIKKINKILEEEGVEVKTIEGNEAKIDCFDLITDKPQVLHIATHGYDNTSEYLKVEDPMHYDGLMKQTGLLLSNANADGKKDSLNSGIMTSYELMRKDLAGIELGVLSSCSSGLGDVNNPTGLTFGPAHALKMAGIERLVVSLWEIQDAVTAIAMEEFYKHYLKSLNERDALKQMQEKLQELGYEDVYYWGAFEVIE